MRGLSEKRSVCKEYKQHVPTTHTKRPQCTYLQEEVKSAGRSEVCRKRECSCSVDLRYTLELGLNQPK
ncbi:hypothetical protein AV530_019355 [Patagioenas fasciata monilis]|uniref:Uncharacterized protein n=1 Tax=Patagioenas fasciata monilis TaxID=372326 RepID=A0A1V4JDC9_PATFA|nr:hypothetical protein AV530_019355 [Patagioenas fasciata monilis]